MRRTEVTIRRILLSCCILAATACAASAEQFVKIGKLTVKADPRYKEWMTNEYMRAVIFPYGKKPR